MGMKIIKSPKGKTPINFNNDPLGEKYVDITFVRRGRLGKILSGRTVKRFNLPKGNRLTRIENHKPKVRSVKISFRKIRKRK